MKNKNGLKPKFDKWISMLFRSMNRKRWALEAEGEKEIEGWVSLSPRGHDYHQGEVFRLYSDALEAWRKNPLAWRIISITTDYVVGARITLSSPNKRFDQFRRAFWNHPKNRVDLRLEAMCDELSRSGDLFILLFRNPGDGMSYIRFVTKDRIRAIKTAENDWETELAYYEQLEDGSQKEWVSVDHPQASEREVIMLHYAINRPLGALLGESDLTSMLTWLQRYSQMLEDRVMLHWAMRAFLWIITVPTDRVDAKRDVYRTPPQTGSVIVKDKDETWEAVAPNLHGADAHHDLRGVRGMIDAGSGYPPHWRGEAADANLATAQAMQTPTERHLMRRQDYFVFILEDILVNAYKRAVEIGSQRRLPLEDYGQLFTINAPDISRQDNQLLAGAAKDIAEAFRVLEQSFPKRSRRLGRLMASTVFRFAGQPQDDQTLDEILGETYGQGTADG
jgi:hypothetical protein